MLAQVENIPAANLIGWIIGVAAAVVFSGFSIPSFRVLC
jgi:hypothetical protein